MNDIKTVLLACPEGKLYWSGPIAVKQSGFLVGGRFLLTKALIIKMTALSNAKAKRFKFVNFTKLKWIIGLVNDYYRELRSLEVAYAPGDA